MESTLAAECPQNKKRRRSEQKVVTDGDTQTSPHHQISSSLSLSLIIFYGKTNTGKTTRATNLAASKGKKIVFDFLHSSSDLHLKSVDIQCTEDKIFLFTFDNRHSDMAIRLIVQIIKFQVCRPRNIVIVFESQTHPANWFTESNVYEKSLVPHITELHHCESWECHKPSVRIDPMDRKHWDYSQERYALMSIPEKKQAISSGAFNLRKNGNSFRAMWSSLVGVTGVTQTYDDDYFDTLFQNGVDVNDKDDWGKPVIFNFCMNFWLFSAPIVKIIDHGAEIVVIDRVGQTPLHIIVWAAIFHTARAVEESVAIKKFESLLNLFMKNHAYPCLFIREVCGITPRGMIDSVEVEQGKLSQRVLILLQEWVIFVLYVVSYPLSHIQIGRTRDRYCQTTIIKCNFSSNVGRHCM